MVTVREDEGALLFEVADDGAGFDLAIGRAARPRLREHERPRRCDRRHASSVESAPGAGTTIRGRLPLGDSPDA